MKNSLIFAILLLLLLPSVVNASTYTPTNDLFENSYAINLIDMAQTQIDNFTTKKYVIFQIDYNYYLVSAKNNDVTVNGNTINMKNTTIIRSIRNQSGYNAYYTYDTINESNTTVYSTNIIVSNINTLKSISSKRFDDYLSNKNIKMLLMFILGLVFALFLTKERNY